MALGDRCLWWGPGPRRSAAVGRSTAAEGPAGAGCSHTGSTPGSRTQPSCRPSGGRRQVYRSAAGSHPLLANLGDKETIKRRE